MCLTLKYDGTSVDTFDESITFQTRHNFESGEGIIYDARGNTPIVNIVDGSTYYAGVINEKKIKLHKTPEDVRLVSTL